MSTTPLPQYKPPLAPYEKGNVAVTAYGGPATSAVDVLMRARAALSARGAWAHGAWTKSAPQGGAARCSLQAIRDVDGEYEAEATRFLMKAIKEKAGWMAGSVQTWNDAPKRKKTEVLAVFDRAIELASK